MAANRSFTDYVSSRFYNEFYSATEKYIEKNPDNLHLDLKNVKHIGEISLSEVEVKFVSVRDFPELNIEFDVIVDAEIVVNEGDYHYDDYDLFNKWFLLRCSGDLGCSLDDFAIREICLYSQKNKNHQPLSDSLVPYIKKEQLDAVANDFLQRHYPEVLKKPMPLEPKKLAEKMGLEVILRDITEDLSIFGQIFFHDSEADFYDPDEHEYISTSVRAQTIFVDPKAYFLRNLGAVNNTIVHECVHWDKHRKAFELERLYNSSATKIKCQVAGGIKNNNKEATDWMEWQANALAPRIQMPLAMFKTKAFELIKQYKQQSGTTMLIDVMEPVIDALATFFCVSRIAAKIRMIDAGYEEAIGTFTYLDGRYIKPHGFKKGSLKRNQTFSIGAVDAAIQSMSNPELNALVKDGSYQYVDAHFVLNHPKYLEKDLSGNTRLTDYARTHMDECCIVFDLSIESNVRERYHSECFLNRDQTSNISLSIKYGGGYEHSTQEKKVKLLADELAENARIYGELPTSYTSSLKMVKKWRGVTFKELGERTKLNERTIRRIVNGEEKCSINSLILLCLSLHLPPEISNHIISNSPVSLNLTDPDHQWYSFALTHLSSQTMDEIRTFLQQHGANPL
ncbi:transcriptional regulator [Proteinivorax tanatarense]|uniref:Transcriptional regulator n=1 Tax=Proteinivorax tanatarense TaxID=1260629 RepID=A0AAU7VK47_9FIRM